MPSPGTEEKVARVLVSIPIAPEVKPNQADREGFNRSDENVPMFAPLALRSSFGTEKDMHRKSHELHLLKFGLTVLSRSIRSARQAISMPRLKTTYQHPVPALCAKRP
jgi:hypothetical protein